MAKKLSIKIDTINFDIDVDDAFAEFLTKSMQKDFNLEGNNELKELLQAYVRKNYALFNLEKEHNTLNNRVETLLEG